MIAPVRCRWLRLQGEAARLLGSQKSRRFCRIAKSPTSFDPASIASGCRQPLMSAPASVPRVARPSEATAFARSAYITEIIFFMLCAIATVVSSALVKILPPQQGVLLVPYAGCPFGNRCRVSFWGPMQGVFPVTEEGSPPGVQAGAPFGGRWRVSVREPMKSVLGVADGGSPPGGEAGVPFGGR